MKTFEERKAEVFRRSEKRIQSRRRRRNRILAFCIPLCLMLTVWSVSLFPPDSAANPGGNHAGDWHSNSATNSGAMNGTVPNQDLSCNDYLDKVNPNNNPTDTADSFSFSLVWGCYGISSYDSETGQLIKTTHATTPADYVTTYHLTKAQKQQIFNLIKDLNVTAYPSIYNPHPNGLISKPSMTLILSVKMGSINKTITAADIALTYESRDSEGQRFLTVCKAIQDILTATDEWNALPEYEYFYD